MIAKMVGLIFGGLVLVFLAIQLVPVERTNLPVTAEIQAPSDVSSILRRSCYDCHSNETKWPWYSRVAPVSWLLERDVREGRRELNFSQWRTLAPARKAKKVKESLTEIENGDMPPWYYLPMHPDAKLTGKDKAVLGSWLKAQMVPPPR